MSESVSQTFAFSGWRLEGGDDTVYALNDELVPVTGDQTCLAVFTATTKKFMVYYQNDDEQHTVLQSFEVEYGGSTPAYSGDTPTRAVTAQ